MLLLQLPRNVAKLPLSEVPRPLATSTPGLARRVPSKLESAKNCSRLWCKKTYYVMLEGAPGTRPSLASGKRIPLHLPVVPMVGAISDPLIALDAPKLLGLPGFQKACHGVHQGLRIKRFSEKVGLTVEFTFT